jgi:SAM-dependent methyltransferase
MQALHHFDVARHLAEANRVLSTGGIFAALSWGQIELPHDIGDACEDFLILAERYWEAERDWVVSGYPGLEFVGECVDLPHATMCKTLTLGDLSRTLQSWSAYRLGTRDCPEAFEAALENLHRLGEMEVEVSWPIKGRIFRKIQHLSDTPCSKSQT